MSDFERTPPHDIGAEQAVTGGMLLSKDAIADVAEILLPEDHYRGAHQLIHEAILHLYGHGEPTDPVAVAHELARRKQLAAAGGAPYLHTCIAAVPTAANAGYYARIVREHSVRRRLTEVGTRLVQLGYTGDGDAAGLIDRAEAEVYGLDQGRESDEFQVLADVLPTALNDIEAARGRGGVVTGVPTGLMDLDALTGGLHGGQMVVIAARPALGKSVLALDFARSAAVKHNLTTGLFSLEMSKSEIGMRLLSAEARVPLTSLRTGQLTEDDWQRLSRRISEVAGAPLFIDDSASLTMSSIRGKSRRLRQRHDLKLIVVDYLQLMSSPGRAENRQQEVSAMSRSLKLLAKELDVPVVAVAQLNRGPEQRADRRPMLADLRESGSIEADADVVILLHREDAYVKDSPRAGEADFIVAKHRNGPTALITVTFQGHYSRFADFARYAPAA